MGVEGWFGGMGLLWTGVVLGVVGTVGGLAVLLAFWLGADDEAGPSPTRRTSLGWRDPVTRVEDTGPGRVRLVGDAWDANLLASPGMKARLMGARNVRMVHEVSFDEGTDDVGRKA